MFIAIIIIRLRRLHSKPRNIFLLGIIFSNLLAFVPAVIELIYWNLPLEAVCQAYLAVVGLPYAILLLNMLSALIDRYVAIKFPLWHRKKVTVRRVCGFLVLSSSFTICLLKFVYISGFIPLCCEIRFIHSKVLGVITIGLFVLCIIVHFVVFRQTKTILKESRTRNPLKSERLRSPCRNQNNAIELNGQNMMMGSNELANELVPIENESRNTKTSGMVLGTTIDRSSSMVIQVDGGTLSRMEMEATRTLIAGVTSLFVTACPPIIFFLIVHSCKLINNFECINLNWLAPYLRELFLIHAVYNPLIWLLRNDEFWLVLKNKIDGITKNYAE